MKIGCSSYSFRKEWGKEYNWNEEGFKSIKEKFPEIEGWEILDGNLEKFLEDIEEEDLKRFKKILNTTGFEWFAITTGSGQIVQNSVPHYKGDAAYIEGFKRVDEFRKMFADDWLENAAAVGVKFMRIDMPPFVMNHVIPFSKALDFNLERNIKFYKYACNAAKEYGIQVGIENHGGFASDMLVLEKMFAKVPDLKFTFDFGNAMDTTRYQMLEKWGDRCHFVHAKAHEFKENGEEAQINFSKIISILKDKGFDGYLSIEWEGPLPGDEGVKKTIDLLKRYI